MLAHPSFCSCFLSLTFLPTLIHLILTCLPVTTCHLHVDIIAIHHHPPLLCLVTSLLHLITVLLHLIIALPCLTDTITALPPLKGPVITLLCLADPITACPHPMGPLVALPHLMNLFIAPPSLHAPHHSPPPAPPYPPHPPFPAPHSPP